MSPSAAGGIHQADLGGSPHELRNIPAHPLQSLRAFARGPLDYLAIHQELDPHRVDVAPAADQKADNLGRKGERLGGKSPLRPIPLDLTRRVRRTGPFFIPPDPVVALMPRGLAKMTGCRVVAIRGLEIEGIPCSAPIAKVSGFEIPSDPSRRRSQAARNAGDIIKRNPHDILFFHRNADYFSVSQFNSGIKSQYDPLFVIRQSLKNMLMLCYYYKNLQEMGVFGL